MEVAEVQAALLICTNVKEAVVVGEDDAIRNKRLVAFLTVQLTASTTSPQELRTTLKAQFPEFMVPSEFVCLKALPVIGVGKVDRKALANLDRSRSFLADHYVSPRNPIENELTVIWSQLLNLPQVGIDDDFFLLGGHSLLAAQMFAMLDEKFGRTYPLSLLLSSPTIRQLAKHFAQPQDTRSKFISLVPLRSSGKRPSIFAVPGVFGNVLGYAELARQLGDDQPFYALQSVGLDGLQPPIETIEEMAALYIREIRSVQSQGPYVIIGACFGATVAYEIAHQLLAAGKKVTYLGLIDPSNREYRRDNAASDGHFEAWNKIQAIANLLSSRIKLYGDGFRNTTSRKRISYALRKAHSVGSTLTDRNKIKRLARELHQLEVASANRRALRRYRWEPLIGQLKTFEVFESHHVRHRRSDRIPWQMLWVGEVNMNHFPAKDSGDLISTYVIELSRMISERLDTALDCKILKRGDSA